MIILGAIDYQLLDRFAFFPRDVAVDHLRLADAKLEALAAHVLDEDPQVHQAAAGNAELFLRGARGHAQRYVGAQLALQSLADLPAREELAVAAREWTVVHAKQHVERRFVDVYMRQGVGLIGIGDRIPDLDRFQADYGAQIPSGDFVNLDSL